MMFNTMVVEDKQFFSLNTALKGLAGVYEEVLLRLTNGTDSHRQYVPLRFLLLLNKLTLVALFGCKSIKTSFSSLKVFAGPKYELSRLKLIRPFL